MTSALCVQCGAPAGLGRCLVCRGELERSCLGCGADMPPIAYDILCDSCTAAQGSDYLAAIVERRERSQYLRACEDCGRPTYADAGPLCPICHLHRLLADPGPDGVAFGRQFFAGDGADAPALDEA
ncbi:MAG: hypothetical protein M3R24_41470 [Chloroflexota bacterium]|nr:hypothetical protein [Chloroflexota bacterium]